MTKTALLPALLAVSLGVTLAATPDHTLPGAGTYQPYTRAAFDAARSTQRVLFFHATWCPTCKRADADIRANLAKLPAGITIFKTDYDRETALKKLYGITYQHTFVLVDAQGRALKKWSGGGLGEIVKAVQTAKL